MGFIELLKLKLCMFNLTDSSLNLIDSFLNLLLEENKIHNLTAITSDEDIVVKHVLDSFEGLEFLKSGDKVLDIGSGAGFPSIPLSILKPDASFTLLDSSSKKTAFMEKAAGALSLKNIKVITGRAEEIAHTDKRGSFDIVLARAVSSLRELVELSIPYLKVGGNLVAFKASKVQEEIDASIAALKLLRCEIVNKKSFLLDGKYERNILIIEKKGQTDKKYPRAYNKIKCKPLQ